MNLHAIVLPDLLRASAARLCRDRAEERGTADNEAGQHPADHQLIHVHDFLLTSSQRPPNRLARADGVAVAEPPIYGIPEAASKGGRTPIGRPRPVPPPNLLTR